MENMWEQREKFDYRLFHKLFDKLYLFQSFLEDSEKTPLILDHDIINCLKLSIFPKLRDINHFERNLDLVKYHKIKHKGAIVGARGVIASYSDISGPENPVYLYEFAHLEKEDKPEEYILELHLDDITMKLTDHLDIKSKNNKKGSDFSRELISRAIKNDDNLRPEQKADLSSKCLIQSRLFEIWKVGFYHGSYQLFITAPHFFHPIESEDYIKYYLKDSAIAEPRKPLPRLDSERLANLTLEEEWYHAGIIDLDEGSNRGILQKDLANRIYNLALTGNFNRINPADLPVVLSIYSPFEIAMLTLAGSDTKEHAQEFREPFIEACNQVCPDKLKEAYSMLEDILKQRK